MSTPWCSLHLMPPLRKRAQRACSHRFLFLNFFFFFISICKYSHPVPQQAAAERLGVTVAVAAVVGGKEQRAVASVLQRLRDEAIDTDKKMEMFTKSKEMQHNEFVIKIFEMKKKFEECFDDLVTRENEIHDMFVLKLDLFCFCSEGCSLALFHAFLDTNREAVSKLAPSTCRPNTSVFGSSGKRSGLGWPPRSRNARQRLKRRGRRTLMPSSD